MSASVTTLLPERLLALSVPHRRGGNQPVALNDPQRAWLVREGQVELFLVSLDEQQVEGARHHLASVGPGGILLGIAEGGAADFVLLAVPHADSLLLEFELAQIQAESSHPQAVAALAAGLEVWLRALSRGMARWAFPRPAIGIGIGPNETVVVPAHRRCSGQSAVAWIRLAPEQGIYLDVQDLPTDKALLNLPLAPEAWLMATTDLHLVSRSTEVALREGDAWDGVVVLHQILFEATNLNLRLANVDEYNRLQARRSSTEADRDQAFAALMAVTRAAQGGVTPAAPDDTPLIAAMRLIGQAEGFVLHLPGLSEQERNLTLDDIVQASGLRSREVSLREGWWAHDFGSLLVFDKTSGQALVLLAGGRSGPQLIDPMSGQRWNAAQERERLATQAYEFTAPLPFKVIGFAELFGFALKRGWRDLVPMLLAGAVGGLIAMTLPVATAYLIDSVIPNHELGHLIEVGLVLAVLGIASFAASYIGSVGFSRAESRMGRVLQSGVMDRVLRLQMGFFQNYSAGDLATRLMAITRIQNLISASSVNTIVAGVFGIFSFAVMFFYDNSLALWASLLTVVYVALSASLSYLRLVQERSLATLTGKLNNTLLQLILGVAKIRLAAAEDRAFARWAMLFADSRQHQLAGQRLAAWQSALNQIMGLAGLLLFVWVIGKPGQSLSLVSIGAFSALLVAYQKFSSGLTMLLQTATELIAIGPQLERARPLLEAVPEIGEKKADPGQISGAIEVSHLTFRYAADSPVILDDISLDIAPGEFVALVGTSGSGKSTLLRLLLGFEQPEAGGILFDGQNLASLDAPVLRRQMGVVMQNAQLLPRSLFDNILGTGGGTLADAWEAATQVGLAEDIRRMPMGMHTMIQEGGGSLSGGQMQRLMIARAIVGHPKILLLDEATSALDNRTQAVVTDSLDRLRVTRIVVAHRLSTVVHADRIYVFDGGKVIEKGNFEQLMQANGHFARLAQRQMA